MGLPYFQSVPAVANIQQAGVELHAAAQDLCGRCAVVDGEVGVGGRTEHHGERYARP